MTDSDDDDFVQPSQPSRKRLSFPKTTTKRKSINDTQPADKQQRANDQTQRAVRPRPAAAPSPFQPPGNPKPQPQPQHATPQQRSKCEVVQQPRLKPCPSPPKPDAEPTCPVCNVLLAAVSDTDTGRHAHVHACLERGVCCAPAQPQPRQPLQARSLNVEQAGPAMLGRRPDSQRCSMDRPPVNEGQRSSCGGCSPLHAPAAAGTPAAEAVAGGGAGCAGGDPLSLAPSASMGCWEHGGGPGVEREAEQGVGEAAGLDGDDGACGLSDGADDVVVQQEWEAWYDDDIGHGGGGHAEDGEVQAHGQLEVGDGGLDLYEREVQEVECAAWGQGAGTGGSGQLPGSFGADVSWFDAGAGRTERKETTEAAGLPSCGDLEHWLERLGLPQYAGQFRAAEVDEETLPHLRDEDLQELGIHSAQDRRTILRAAAALPPGPDAPGPGPTPAPGSKAPPGPSGTTPQPPHHQPPQCPSTGPQQAGAFVAPFSSLYNQSAQHPERSRITSYFKPNQLPPPHPAAAAAQALRATYPQAQAAAGMRPIGFGARPQGPHVAAAAGVASAAMVGLPGPAAGQQELWLAAPLTLARPQLLPAATCGPQGPGGLSRRVQRWHTIPGTRFLVDLFSPASRDIRGCDHWFLTHFHADHYKGLSKHFSQGVIVCSPVTAQLISTKLKVPWARIRAVALDTPTLIEGTTITLIEANHCPGAVMIAAELPGGTPVLHTGDARLVPEMREHPTLQRLTGRSLLVLDTTYCDPKYTFPSQKDTLKFTLDAIRSEKFNPRALFLFGTYTIGKERLFLEVARELGKKVYVCKEKMQTLQCCNLAPAYANLLTTNHLETNIHAVPLFKVNAKGVTEILAHYKGRYTSAVGVAPTGWSYEKEQQKGRGGGRRVQRGGSSVIIYQVPYSEHSSFNELHDFVSWFKPLEILPSVGNDNGGPKVKHMRELLLQPQPRNSQPTIASMFKNAAAK